MQLQESIKDITQYLQLLKIDFYRKSTKDCINEGFYPALIKLKDFLINLKIVLMKQLSIYLHNKILLEISVCIYVSVFSSQNECV